MAKMIMKAVASIDHRKRGMRARVIPGARIFMMVATSSTATARAANSVKVIIWAQTSGRLPMPYWGPESGV